MCSEIQGGTRPPFSALLSCVESESESASDGKVKTAGVCPAPLRNRWAQSQPLLAVRGNVGEKRLPTDPSQGAIE